jgi:hypothetical protein
MTSKDENHGIRIEGSATVISGAMAAGPGARAEGTADYSAAPVPASLAELRMALSSLIVQLHASPAGIDDPGAIAQIAVSAQRETARDKPDKKLLGGLLQALMAGVRNSATLANAVLAIQHAVTILL